jgi:hypothetical protein
MWSVISIKLPGGMVGRRLPAALVCSSSLTPHRFEAAQRAGHAGTVAALVGVLAPAEHGHAL